MKKRIVLIMAACLVSATFMFAQTSPQANQQIHRDNKEIRQDKKDLMKDKAQRNHAIRNGRPNRAKVEQHQVNKDKRELHRDVRDKQIDKKEAAH